MSEQPKKVLVDLEDMMEAMQSHSYDFTYYLDLKNGNVLLATDEMVGGEEADMDDLLEDEPTRYRLIESVSSSQGFHVMEDFVTNLPSGAPKNSLRHALEKPKPFRNFKDALSELGDIRDQWFVYELAAYKELAERWLRDEEIDANVVYQRANLAE